MTVLKIFEQAPKTKQEISECSQAIKNEFLSGDIDVLAADLFLKKIEELVKGVREDKEVKGIVLQELELYTEKTVKVHGCEITKKGLTSYDYDLCGDNELFSLQNQKAVIDEKIKLKQKQLQLLQEPMTVVNDDTGEIITLYPAAKKVTDSFSIKIL